MHRHLVEQAELNALAEALFEWRFVCFRRVSSRTPDFVAVRRRTIWDELQERHKRVLLDVGSAGL